MGWFMTTTLPRVQQVQVFISSTSELNSFGSGLEQWMLTDPSVCSLFRPFYYLSHVPTADEPDIREELDLQLRESSLLIALLGNEPGTTMPKSGLRRLLRRPSETYVNYEQRRARELGLPMRRFRHAAPDSQARWMTVFRDSPDLCQKVRDFLVSWFAARLQAIGRQPTWWLVGAVALLVACATTAAVLGYYGKVDALWAAGAVVVPVLALPALVLHRFLHGRLR